MSNAQIIHGDCIEAMRELPDNSMDSIVTDPPYGLGFAGKAWDGLPPSKEWAEECLRILKPGGHLIAFGGTRTFHRLAVAVEDAGFEIRDSIAWLYSQGFPKSQNLGKRIPERDGWGTALSPAFEPIVMARKPIQGTVFANVLKHGTGAINIDASRVETTDKLSGGVKPGSAQGEWRRPFMDDAQAIAKWSQKKLANQAKSEDLGRYPSNIIFDEDQAAGLAESRFFYCAKAPKSERPVVNGVSHPTVKPLTLMRYLVKLVTHPGGTVLDPFAGSGTTVEAALLDGFDVIGIEREAEYLPLIRERVRRHQVSETELKAMPVEETFDLFGEVA